MTVFDDTENTRLGGVDGQEGVGQRRCVDGEQLMGLDSHSQWITLLLYPIPSPAMCPVS